MARERLRMVIRQNIFQGALGLFDPAKLEMAVSEDGQIKPKFSVGKSKVADPKTTSRGVGLIKFQEILSQASAQERLAVKEIFDHEQNKDVTIGETTYSVSASRLAGVLATPLLHSTFSDSYGTVLENKGIKLSTMQKIAFSALVMRCKTIVQEDINAPERDGKKAGFLAALQTQFHTDFPDANERMSAAKRTKMEKRDGEMTALLNEANELTADALMEIISNAIKALPEGAQIFEGDTCKFTPEFKAILARDFNRDLTKAAAFSLKIGGGIALILIALAIATIGILIATGIIPLAGAGLIGAAVTLAAVGLGCMIVGALLINNGRQGQNKAMIGFGSALVVAGLAMVVLSILAATGVIPLVGAALIGIAAAVGVVALVCMVAGPLLVNNGRREYNEVASRKVDSTVEIVSVAAAGLYTGPANLPEPAARAKASGQELGTTTEKKPLLAAAPDISPPGSPQTHGWISQGVSNSSTAGSSLPAPGNSPREHAA